MFSCGYRSIRQATALHLAVVYDHPDIVTFFLNHDAAVTDNLMGQNCLDVAVAEQHENCALAIVQHNRYRNVPYK